MWAIKMLSRKMSSMMASNFIAKATQRLTVYLTYSRCKKLRVISRPAKVCATLLIGSRRYRPSDSVVPALNRRPGNFVSRLQSRRSPHKRSNIQREESTDFRVCEGIVRDVAPCALEFAISRRSVGRGAKKMSDYVLRFQRIVCGLLPQSRHLLQLRRQDPSSVLCCRTPDAGEFLRRES